MLTNLPKFRFDSSLQKRMKQGNHLAYVNYTLIKLKELSHSLGDPIIFENSNVQ